MLSRCIDRCSTKYPLKYGMFEGLENQQIQPEKLKSRKSIFVIILHPNMLHSACMDNIADALQKGL